MSDLAFVLVQRLVCPDPAGVVASALAGGIGLTQTSAAGDSIVFELAGGPTLMVAVMPAPYPDAARVAAGPTSPSPDQVAATPAHLIVTALGLQGTARERDTTMAILAAAVIENVDAVGVRLGHGAVFHKATLFAELAMLAGKQGEPLPPEVAVDVTAAQLSATRMSFLTHTMQRYGREEFFVTCPIKGTGALQFVFDLTRWLLADPDKHLPTGDTIGRTAEEKVTIQRVPNPTGSGPKVIRLDLP